MNELRLNDWLAMEPVEDAFKGLLRPWRAEWVDRAPQMRIDVREDDERFTVRADVPGVSKEDIDVQIDGRQVTISAERKKVKQERQDGGRILRAERQEGYAMRSFGLSCPVDESHAQASYRDGVLELNLPKKMSGVAKRLAIA